MKYTYTLIKLILNLIKATRSSRMLAEKKLLEAHIKHGIKALNIYDRCPKIHSGDIRNQNLAQLQESINVYKI